MSYNSLFSPYEAATLYVPWQDIVYNQPDFYAQLLGAQDISPPGSPAYYVEGMEVMTETEKRIYTGLQTKVLTGAVQGGKTTISLSPEEKMIGFGMVENYVDRLNNTDLNKIRKGLTSDTSTGKGGGTLPIKPEPVPVDPTTTTDPSQIINYYYTTTNNYNNDPSQGPSGSDSFSWLFPMMIMMMLMNTFGGVQSAQEQKPKVVYESW